MRVEKALSGEKSDSNTEDHTSMSEESEDDDHMHYHPYRNKRVTYFVIILALFGVVGGIWSTGAGVLAGRDGRTFCPAGDIFSLGIGHVKSKAEIFRFLGPFANEIANVMTLTWPIHLYPHHTKTLLELVQKTLVDVVALLGIVANGVYYSNNYDAPQGLLKAELLLVFSFVIPNLCMAQMLNVKKGEQRWLNPKILLGMFIIYCLDVMVATIFCGLAGNHSHDVHTDEAAHSNSTTDASSTTDEHHLIQIPHPPVA